MTDDDGRFVFTSAKFSNHNNERRFANFDGQGKKTDTD